MTTTVRQQVIKPKDREQTIMWSFDSSCSRQVGADETFIWSVLATAARQQVSPFVRSIYISPGDQTDWSHWLAPFSFEPSHGQPPWFVRHAISESESIIATYMEAAGNENVLGNARTLVTWTKLSGLPSDIYFDEQGVLYLEISLDDGAKFFVELDSENHLTGGVLDAHAQIVKYWRDMTLDDYVQAVFDD